MVGAEEWGEGPRPATGAKVLVGPGTGGILWVQWSGLILNRMVRYQMGRSTTELAFFRSHLEQNDEQ